jgi:signal transduction histidine kinase
MRTRKEDSDEEEWNWIFQSILLSKYEPERGIVELVGVNYDITEFKDIEQELIHARDKAQEMDRLKSAFLANMSHEIRTPLNAIVGFSDLLINATDKKEKQEFFNILRKNNDMLLQLINDILDLSKIEAGTMQLTYENVDVNKLCNDIIMSMRFKTSPNVKITFEPSETKCYIKVDSTRLNQVITNFMTNAIKFTTEGSITLTYSWIDDEYIKFSVTDTGIGIDEENKHSIFDRFVKLNSFIPGTGLGLSICRSIVELLKGKIGVDSVLGEGSSFWFVLPKNKK